MVGLELFESKLFMCVSSYNFAFRYHIGELSHGLEELFLVGSLEVLELGSVMESDKVWDTSHLEVTWSISDYGRVHGSKYEIWILVGFGGTLEGWLDSHTWRACGTPEIDDKARTFLDELLEMREASNLADFSDLCVSSSWIRWWSSAHSTESLHQTLKHCWVHSSCHICNIWRKTCW